MNDTPYYESDSAYINGREEDIEPPTMADAPSWLKPKLRKMRNNLSRLRRSGLRSAQEMVHERYRLPNTVFVDSCSY
jgi:hypothetical protein